MTETPPSGREQEPTDARPLLVIAEMSFAERKNLLALALLRVQCDLYLSEFVEWVFNVTRGGLQGELLKSYQNLTTRPWALCCSYSKARATVKSAKRLGLISVRESSYRSGSNSSSGYTIDWEGVRSLVYGRPQNGSGQLGGVSTGQGSVFTGQGSAPTQHSAPDDPGREPGGETPRAPDNLFYNLSSVPEPVPEAGAAAGNGNEVLETGPRSGQVSGAVKPRSDAHAPGSALQYLRSGCEEILELQEAVDRRVDPLPPENLRYGGAYKILEVGDLRQALRMVEWFRRQLGLCHPVMADSEADLLLVLAAARYACEGEVRRNRIAKFVSAVSRQKWRQVLPYLPEAQKVLDGLRNQFGDGLLRGRTWPPDRLDGGEAENAVESAEVVSEATADSNVAHFTAEQLAFMKCWKTPPAGAKQRWGRSR